MAERLGYISFTAKKFELFKVVYTEALQTGRESFIFENKEILTQYAKYLIEHLEGTFKEE